MLGVFWAGRSHFWLVPIGDFDITRRYAKRREMSSFVKVTTGGDLPDRRIWSGFGRILISIKFGPNLSKWVRFGRILLDSSDLVGVASVRGPYFRADKFLKLSDRCAKNCKTCSFSQRSVRNCTKIRTEF